jgi:hypothetical protein
LHKWRCLDSLSNSLLRRLASAAYLEDLDDGVTRKTKFPTKFNLSQTRTGNSIFVIPLVFSVYRQGDRGTNWYFILSGEVVMTTCSDRSNNKDASSGFHHVSDILLHPSPNCLHKSDKLCRITMGLSIFFYFSRNLVME